jgi:hypothetical protein
MSVAMENMSVILANGEGKNVPAYMLDFLIREKKIVAFQRSDGWVHIGRDSIRKVQLPLINTGERWSDFMFKRTEH